MIWTTKICLLVKGSFDLVNNKANETNGLLTTAQPLRRENTMTTDTFEDKAISKKAILKQANVELIAANETLNKQVEQLTKQLESEKAYNKARYETINKLESEIEEVHSLLDSLPNAPKRIRDRKENEYYEHKFSIIARLASWLASK